MDAAGGDVRVRRRVDLFGTNLCLGFEGVGSRHRPDYRPGTGQRRRPAYACALVRRYRLGICRADGDSLAVAPGQHDENLAGNGADALRISHRLGRYDLRSSAGDNAFRLYDRRAAQGGGHDDRLVYRRRRQLRGPG